MSLKNLQQHVYRFEGSSMKCDPILAVKSGKWTIKLMSVKKHPIYLA